MKKTLLFGMMLLGAFAMSAGEVQQDENAIQAQTIPTTDGAYLDFSKGYCYYAGNDGNSVVDGTALGNMRPGSFVVLQLNNTVDNHGYVLDFQGGNKNEGGVLVVRFYESNPLDDEEAEPFFSQDVTIQAMGNWNDKIAYKVTIPTSFPEGDVYMKLLASRSNDVAYAGNFDEFEMTAIESDLSYYTLATSVNLEEAGTVYGNDAESYAEGSTVTLTAKPNDGYRFVQWEIGTEVSTENPLQIVIDGDKEVLAVFEEIPNALQADLTFDIAAAYATSGSISIDTTGETPVIGSVKNGASVTYRFSVAETGIYNVIAHWTNKYDASITMNVSTDSEEFNEETAVTVDVEATGSWDNFEEIKWESFALEAGTTYFLRMSFATSDGWAGNTNYLALQKAGSTGIADVRNDDAAVRYYNLQGIEVDPAQAKGLLINNAGQKIYKK